MKNVKTPTSDSYHAYLIESLKDPEEAAAYLEAILEENDPEPELFGRALSNVAKALGEEMSPSVQAQLEADVARLSEDGNRAIYQLLHCLKALGLRLSVSTDS